MGGNGLSVPLSIVFVPKTLLLSEFGKTEAVTPGVSPAARVGDVRVLAHISGARHRN